ncbi:ATPase [Macrococcoides goetzii]|uniref:ATPase n=1 Tax=Macrococcoides goetzii TaxID=1891097 RepID=A0A395G9N0_9STAP|nr:FGGY-family carbohydrate kinase [Macrococcus goetzii]RAI80662.1 ATPase [Macrococcus goetzii]
MSKYNDDLFNHMSLGIEFGSTRIKCVAIDDDFESIAVGVYEWENKFINGFWTYSINDVWIGIQKSYKHLVEQLEEIFGKKVTTFKSIGISAMMHGYLAFDKNDDLLVPFRTWRNTTTNQAAEELTKLFEFNIPERWSIAHYHQALLNNEEHVKNIEFITTLSGYVHWYLTGEKVLGIGDASGMFPINEKSKDYNEKFVKKYNELIKNSEIDISSLLPKIKLAGEVAGKLTPDGAKLLDPDSNLIAGIPFCAPEGDAGTGMVATNSVEIGTCNISAGTSAFSMLVLEDQLKNLHPEIDMVTTPTGKPVAMVHTNNCTSEINEWVNLFGELLDLFDYKYSKEELYNILFNQSLIADENTGNLINYGYISGENITNIDIGAPMLLRKSNANFNIANLMKSLIYSSFATLKIGMDILTQEEKKNIKHIVAHGGIFNSGEVAQDILAGVLNTNVSTMKTSNEGGAWGIAVLSKFIHEENFTLEEYLKEEVFTDVDIVSSDVNSDAKANFNNYLEDYKKYLSVEREADNLLKSGDKNV